jgi:DMSO/TMAO reductase YedYZ molybdopterin-dependent catalytic subunit
METARPAPLWALELDPTPTEHHFVRDHFPAPALDPEAWRLEVGGAVERPLTLSLAEIRALPSRSLPAVLECAGHRRDEFDPPARGIAWSAGAVSQAVWAGTPLRGILELARPSTTAAAVVFEGADHGPFDGEGDYPFARAVPLAKALDLDTLVAWEMNGGPLPAPHGAPARAIVPGWYATDSVKWLVRVEVVEDVFDGPFEARDYRLDGRRMTGMAVHALVTSHADGAEAPAGPTEIRGIAWGGAGPARVDVRVGEGTWSAAELSPAASPYALARWRAAIELPAGDVVVSARAGDESGSVQPDAPAWNERGYGNASVQRVRLRVAPPAST